MSVGFCLIPNNGRFSTLPSLLCLITTRYWFLFLFLFFWELSPGYLGRVGVELLLLEEGCAGSSVIRNIYFVWLQQRAQGGSWVELLQGMRDPALGHIWGRGILCDVEQSRAEQSSMQGGAPTHYIHAHHIGHCQHQRNHHREVV